MVILVLILNGLIACLCLLLAWQIWQWRRQLARFADALSAAERNTHAVLHGAPEAIQRGQIGVRQLRQQVRQLEPQLLQMQQVLGLISLGYGLWRRQTRTLKAVKHRP